ncbi:MAG: hypothetical protein F6K24_47395, partial [Okeania sp. SIO2D1]|nr:hypothetical protein [Okeania sp. SIO2D1]
QAGTIARIRELWLQLQSVNRIQSPIINRLRQQLAYEFPEAALMKSKQRDDNLCPLWKWLEGKTPKTKYYDNLYDKSVAVQLGIEISPFTRQLTKMLNEVHQWEASIVQEMSSLVNDSQFQSYNQCFDLFGIGIKPRSLLLSQIYPITQFESLPHFKRRLGVGQTEDSSGDEQKFNSSGGSKLCRTQLYLWILDIISPVKNRPNTRIGKRLGEFYDLRASRYKDNPELWKKKAIERIQKRELNRLKTSLNLELEKLVPKDSYHQFNSTVSLMLNAFELNLAGLEQISPNLKQREVKRGFGNLVICQTAAYGVKLLFKELKKST